MSTDALVDEIVANVLARMGSGGGGARKAQVPSIAPSKSAAQVPRGTLGIYDDPDAAVRAAQRGHLANEKLPLAVRQRMIAAMRAAALANLEALSAHAVAESGLGRYHDKLAKNRLVIEKTPGPEILRPVAYSGDDGLMLTERASYGVILAVTPTTNPTETILCNAIGMLAGGNSVVFNVHPAAAKVSNWFVHLLNEAIVAAGGPPDTIVSIAEPTVASAQALMKHAAVRLVVVTGGPAVVASAMASGKKVIAAGPGNPPAVVDETAHLGAAADAIVRGASLDNNIVCIAEKEIIAVDHIAGELVRQLSSKGALLLTPHQVRQLERVVLDGDHVNKAWVGKDASVLAQQIGLPDYGPELRVLLAEVEEGHPFVQHELLMPVLGLVRARDCADAIAMALRVEHGFHHTATMHSTNVAHLAAMARVCNASIFVKNDASYAGLGLGGEGYTSFTIASPTGEGLTTAVHFTRERRCTLKDAFRFV